MRGMFYFGGSRRNQPVKLVDQHPVADHGQKLDTGNAGLDGYSVLSRAHPDAQGCPPAVPGVVGPVYQGPDRSFEE